MSDISFSADQLAQLKTLVDACQNNLQILNHPQLKFFREFLCSLGSVIPPPPCPKFNPAPSGDTADNASAPEEPAVAEDSDVELDMEGVTASEPIDESQEMGDVTKEPTDEERDQSDEKRSAAMRAFSEQKFDEAINLYTEAIVLNPQSALLFAKRGQVYLKLNKLYSCIKDCSHALELNCDSAAAYKFRGRAYRLLGKFEEASQDLCESLKIDYDDQTNEWLQEVKPNAEKLRQHKLGAQRKQEEKEHSEKIKRAREAQEARARAAKAATHAAEAAEAAGETPFGASPRFGPTDYTALLSDPDFLEAIQDPEVTAAFQDVTMNPANFFKYQNNPKIMAFIEKLQTKFGAKGQNFPNFPPGFGGAPGTTPGPQNPADSDDVGLD